MQVTAIILAKNEERQIKDAILSVSFCDEVIVIDDMSSDKTAEIARQMGAKIITHDSSGDFAAQRNFAVRQATHKWILFLDADERISKELKQKLLQVSFFNKNYSAYRFKRRDFFWGKELKWGEVRSARMKGIVRLIQKGKGSFEGKVHEIYKTQNEGKISEGYIDHFPHQSIKDFLKHINYYSSLRAVELSCDNKKPSFLPILYMPIGKFLYTYFFLLGFLDKAEGFVYSFLMSFHSFLVRAKHYVSQFHVL